VESGGNFNARGASGEKGRAQFLEATFEMWSRDVAGKVLPFTEANEYYVAVMKVDGWLKTGYTESQIAQIWNTGRPGPCIRGINRHNVAYDSCAYERAVLAHLSR
jgi:hypothetical protein